jgi:hypothetical protein
MALLGHQTQSAFDRYRGISASIEMNRRLMDALVTQQESANAGTERMRGLTAWLVGLTVALGILQAAQLVVAIRKW